MALWARAWGIGDRRRLSVADIPPEVLALVDAREGSRCCSVCRRVGLSPPADEPLELDHKMPLAAGGDNNWTNLQWLCRSHNRAKGDGVLTPAQERDPAWLRRARRPS